MDTAHHDTLSPAWATPRGRSLGAAAAGVLLNGTWAFAANIDLGVRASLRAGAAQACSSFVLTLTLSLLMEALFRVPASATAGAALAAVGAFCGSAALTVATHALAGTPQLARTVVPVLTVAAVFTSAYSLNLWRAARRFERRQGA
jgi:hypothetical protein